MEYSWTDSLISCHSVYQGVIKSVRIFHFSLFSQTMADIFNLSLTNHGFGTCWRQLNSCLAFFLNFHICVSELYMHNLKHFINVCTFQSSQSNKEFPVSGNISLSLHAYNKTPFWSLWQICLGIWRIFLCICAHDTTCLLPLSIWPVNSSSCVPPHCHHLIALYEENTHVLYWINCHRLIVCNACS